VKVFGLALAAAFLVAATPSPSPSLDGLLAAPPAGFAELTTAELHGAHFTASDWASTADASKQSGIVNTLNHDGFVDGYGNTWVSQSAQHVLVEAVFAFTGGRGAHDWLTATEAADKKDPTYVRADTTSGLGTYYGAHIADAAGKTFGDVFSFVKGNDFFVVGVVSTKDDALAQATSQATSQYSTAPAQTIPSDQWPENNVAHNVGAFAGWVIVAILAIAVAAIAAVVRRRRRPAVASAPAGVQLSPDGSFWWDGQAWRDAAREAPPFAQRSADGALWWDGRAWRPVPQAAPPQ
jgi:hypothetical protein